MDFGALPPEINSARIYSGPGSRPLMQAAAAWQRLANELTATAASYSSVISGLTGDDWLGPSALSMAAAAVPYVAWMRATAASAEQAAAQAVAAANAYESAYAATVPPTVIAANRRTMLSLVKTNVFGQNTPAIATSEAQYGEIVGPGHRGDGGLCGRLGGRVAVAAVHPATGDHQRGRVAE